MGALSFLMVAIAAVVGACSPVAIGNGVIAYEDVPDDGFLYSNRAKTHGLVFANNLLTIGMLAPERVRQKGLRGDYVWDAPLVSCSDQQVRCLQAERYVFAIPKGKIRQGATFIGGGKRFIVSKCDLDDCRRATIKFECRNVVDGICGGLSSKVRGGGSFDFDMYFQYERGVGVTSIKMPKIGALGQDFEVFSLSGRVGILAE